MRRKEERRMKPEDVRREVKEAIYSTIQLAIGVIDQIKPGEDHDSEGENIAAEMKKVEDRAVENILNLR